MWVTAPSVTVGAGPTAEVSAIEGTPSGSDPDQEASRRDMGHDGPENLEGTWDQNQITAKPRWGLTPLLLIGFSRSMAIGSIQADMAATSGLAVARVRMPAMAITDSPRTAANTPDTTPSSSSAGSGGAFCSRSRWSSRAT